MQNRLPFIVLFVAILTAIPVIVGSIVGPLLSESVRELFANIAASRSVNLVAVRLGSSEGNDNVKGKNGSRERRLRNFDSLLLFLAPIFAITFTLSFSLTGKIEVAYGFLPLLVLGLIFPLYIGYIRGGILLDSVEERVRGWIYFLNGVITYLLSLTLFGFALLALPLQDPYNTLARSVISALFYVTALLVTSGSIWRWFFGNISGPLGISTSSLLDRVYEMTARTGYLAGSALAAGSYLAITSGSESTRIVLLILGVVIGGCIFVIQERRRNSLLSLIPYASGVTLEIRRKGRSGYPAWYSLIIGSISLWLTLASIDLVFLGAPIGITTALIAVSLASILLAYVVTPRESLSITKKNGAFTDDDGRRLDEMIKDATSE